MRFLSRVTHGPPGHIAPMATRAQGFHGRASRAPITEVDACCLRCFEIDRPLAIVAPEKRVDL
jgi:hypothetical protein